MTGFKARTSGVGSNRSTNLATTTAQKVVTKGPLWYIQREKTKRTDIRNYYSRIWTVTITTDHGEL